MCGIVGLFTLDEGPRSSLVAVTTMMADTMPHRGPDGHGAWGDPEAGIGLGHRRLAIVDLSDTGKQPMHSADGRYVITYNGEVYNFQDLRSELSARGHVFRGTSDTEVMLAAFAQWGVNEAVKRFVGMFAFALFDRRERKLHLVRDRLGVKPLYWTDCDGTILFGSELRALRAHPEFRGEIDRDAMAAIVAYSYIPAPATAYKSVFKLPAGSILTFEKGHAPELTHYWRIEDVASSSGQRMLSADDAADALDALLHDAIRRRMIADVPVGAFLSGGIDSSTVVAIMQAETSRPVRSFTVGFSDATHDESAIARQVAQHLGTDHTEIRLEDKDALELVPSIPDWFDEPFGDSSQLPTYLVSRATRQHVTVALSGDGGDELFAGYPKYRWLERLWRSAGALPRPLRATAGQLLGALPERMLQPAARTILDAARADRVGEKARRLALALRAQHIDGAALALARVGFDQNLVNGTTRGYRLHSLPGLPEGLDYISRMQAIDIATYLPDDILTKVDRCSMAVSLESREPLLDHRLIEFVWSLPPAIRQGNRPKGLLRAVLSRYVPSEWMDRPKRGFSIPLANWLRGPLRDWASTLLAPARVRQEALFDPAAIDRLWQRHLSGAENHATGLWNVLMVRAWMERWHKT